LENFHLINFFHINEKLKNAFGNDERLVAENQLMSYEKILKS